MNIFNIDWKEWDRVVGCKLKDPLVGTYKEPVLTENQWAKQYITALIEQEREAVIKAHNLIAIATTKASDGEYYDKQVKERIENLIKDLSWQSDKNREIVKNLQVLITPLK